LENTGEKRRKEEKDKRLRCDRVKMKSDRIKTKKRGEEEEGKKRRVDILYSILSPAWEKILYENGLRRKVF
jgi:hypothetical protein